MQREKNYLKKLDKENTEIYNNDNHYHIMSVKIIKRRVTT